MNPPLVSRRHAAALVAALPIAWAASGRTAWADSPPSPVDQHWRAVSRFGYGPSGAPPAGPQGQAWALAQLAQATAASRQPAALSDGLAGFAAPLPTLFASFRQEREARSKGDTTPGFSRDVTRQAATWRLVACSRADVENPLLARMTEFWFNHLNVFVGKGAVRPFIGHYVLNAIRPHALGRYEDLLLASARHPAMLFYLDQAQSVAEGATARPAPAAPAAVEGRRARGLNENYARELMELHTLGVLGGYTQANVRELARILTGWGIDPQNPDGFRFAPRLHEAGDKMLLGQRIAAGGVEEGEAAIRLLARHSATAQRIAQRLAQWFVADQPAPALVQRLAQRYSDTQGDIRAVMQTLMESPETWAPQARLFKTPQDYACSVLAASGVSLDERQTQQVLGFLQSAGQPVHGWQTPDGYKTDAATWLSPEALSRRADFAMAIGRRMSSADTLMPWLTPASRSRIAQEAPALQPGLALASPEFMYK